MSPMQLVGDQHALLATTGSNDERDLLVCFSHLRWDFVFQRPQHLMTRFARDRDVIYWEEPIEGIASVQPTLRLRTCVDSGVIVATPILSPELSDHDREAALRDLLNQLLRDQTPTLWYYTPMMLAFSRHLQPACVVYDCMDELANFKFAPPELIERERELLAMADVVFTGGYSLYEAKQHLHANIHPFPSSVDAEHFAKARQPGETASDLPVWTGPKLGFYGVIDERMDLDLLAAVAAARLDWALVIVGPVVKIDPADLPQAPNLFYPGGRAYDDLPACLADWDVALMPFAVNESTRFISPTKTPEYLAAGRPVVSTPIRDVVRHYGDLQGVFIADGAEAFIAACDEALALGPTGPWLDEADAALASLSWDETFGRMLPLVTAVKGSATDTRTGAATRQARPRYDYLIVGAGFAGAVLGERLATQLNKRVLLIDRRPHIGGNAFDEFNEGGVLTHRYGPHIFHTNSDAIVDYLSKFTEWRPYEHRVLASLPGLELVPVPINRTTLNGVYGLDLQTDEDAERFLADRAEPVMDIKTSEDVVISQVGGDLYRKFFRGYTRKQWGLDPSELDKSVTARVPTRANIDDRYFTDSFQAMPLHGYTKMFEAMVAHENITIETGVEFSDVRQQIDFDRLIFTGRIDEYFDYRFGALPYRSLEFKHVTLEQEQFQPVGTVNYPDEDIPFTRISEYKHITGQVCSNTTITYEFPRADGDPYYPIPRADNQALYKRYESLALAESDVQFVGRLATYRYYNMDQVVGQALATFRRICEREEATGANTRLAS